MNRTKRIEEKLLALKPHHLKVIDDTPAHHGHAGNPGSGESHFNIEIAAAELEGLSRVEQHKLINNLLKDEFTSGLHALSVKIVDRTIL